jgi:hypothetical protein
MMGSLLKWAGIIWALLGILNMFYGLIEVVPSLTSSLTALLASASQYAQTVAAARQFGAMAGAMVIFMSIAGYVIPGLLLAGVGQLIRLQEHSKSISTYAAIERPS